MSQVNHCQTSSESFHSIRKNQKYYYYFHRIIPTVRQKCYGPLGFRSHQPPTKSRDFNEGNKKWKTFCGLGDLWMHVCGLTVFTFNYERIFFSPVSFLDLKLPEKEKIKCKTILNSNINKTQPKNHIKKNWKRKWVGSMMHATEY